MRFKVAFFIILIAAIILPTVVPIIPAQANIQDSINSALEEKHRLEQELDQQKNTSRTLSEQLAYTENQIRLNELEIQDTQGQIQSTQNLLVQTNNDIQSVTDKLNVLDETVKRMTEVAESRIRNAYKMSRTPEFGVLIQAENFTGVLKTYQYMKELEAEDARILGLVNQNVKEYSDQKANLEKLKSEKETLKAQLEESKAQAAVQQQELDIARDNKDKLLAASQNDEAYYSNLIKEQEALIASLASAVVAPGASSFWVNRGDIIGIQGSSGCATGDHLHFGLRKVNMGTYLGDSRDQISTGGWIDPMPYVENGTLGKPLDSYTISQPFGYTAWGGYDYGPNGHPATDMYSYVGAPVRAAESGVATRMQSMCWGSLGKGVIISHPNGWQTLYWHLR